VYSGRDTVKIDYNAQTYIKEKNKEENERQHSNLKSHEGKSFKIKDSCSYPSKLLEFSSCQRHHKIQWGTAFQKAMFLCLLKEPCQAVNISRALFGITYWSPNKQNAIDHKSKAIGQWRRSWSRLPHFLHMQHQSKTIIPFFQSLSVNKIFSRVAV